MPNYEEWTTDELKEVFIHINDNHYANKAFTILKQLALRFSIDLHEITLTHIIENPLTLNSTNFYSTSNLTEPVAASYTREAINVRDKLIRLKKLEPDN